MPPAPPTVLKTLCGNFSRLRIRKWKRGFHFLLFVIAFLLETFQDTQEPSESSLPRVKPGDRLVDTGVFELCPAGQPIARPVHATYC